MDLTITSNHASQVKRWVDVPLIVDFVIDNGRLVRQVNTTCMLYRSDENTYIDIHDMMIVDAIGMNRIHFYDMDTRRFQFRCRDIDNLMSDNSPKPHRIYLEIMEINNGTAHIILSPGIWRMDDYGVEYRHHDDIALYDRLRTRVTDSGLKNPTVFKQEFFGERECAENKTIINNDDKKNNTTTKPVVNIIDMANDTVKRKDNLSRQSNNTDSTSKLRGFSRNTVHILPKGHVHPGNMKSLIIIRRIK